MSSEIEIVALDQVSWPAVLRLLEAGLGPGVIERSHAFWRWKHESNPFGRSPAIAAVHEGEPVALRAFMRWRWRAGRSTVAALRAVDTVTHPDWRRGGLFRRLTLELLSRLTGDPDEFVFNTPNRRSLPGYLGMGWQDLGRIALHVRPRKPLRIVRRAIRRQLAPASNQGGPPDRGFLRPLGELFGQAGLSTFLDAWAEGDPRLRTPRDVPYLRWRYEEPPELSYGVLWELQGSSGAVLVARRRWRGGLAETLISELLVSDDRLGLAAADRLLSELCLDGGADYFAAIAAPATPEAGALRRADFLRVPRLGPAVAVRPLDVSRPGPILAGFRPAVGDLEVF